MPETRTLPRSFTMHWGAGQVIEEARVTLEHHEPCIQLMEYQDGEAAGTHTLRFCSYDLRGRFQRSPLMINEDDLPALREAIDANPRLKALLKRLVE